MSYYKPIIKQTIRSASCAMGEGNMAMAMNHLRAGLRYANKFHDSDEKIYILGAMASITFKQGDFETAEGYIIDAMTTKGAHPEAYLSVKCDLIEMLLFRGDEEAALAISRDIIKDLNTQFPDRRVRPPIIMALEKFLLDLTCRLTRQK